MACLTSRARGPTPSMRVDRSESPWRARNAPYALNNTAKSTVRVIAPSGGRNEAIAAGDLGDILPNQGLVGRPLHFADPDASRHGGRDFIGIVTSVHTVRNVEPRPVVAKHRVNGAVARRDHLRVRPSSGHVGTCRDKQRPAV